MIISSVQIQNKFDEIAADKKVWDRSMDLANQSEQKKKEKNSVLLNIQKIGRVES